MFIDTRQTGAIANAQPLPARGASEPMLDAAYLLKVLWNRRRMIVVSIIACTIAALAFGQLAAARYTATVQVLIDPNDLRVVDNVLRGQNQLTETHVTQVENQVRVLLSNNVARRVVERLGLDRDPEFTGPPVFDFKAALRALLGAQPAGGGDPALDALNALKKRVRAKRIDRTYVVDASVWAYDPHKAVQLANALLEAFMEEQSASRGEAARRASGSLAARLAELRDRVQQAEQRVEDYKRANGLISSSGTLVNERQLTELNSQLVLARTRVAEAKARYEKIRDAQRGRADPSAIGEAVGSATITALRTQLAEILRKEGEVNATLGRRHPAVIEIESQARRIRRLIDEEVARIGEAARNDMERAVANEATLAANLERLKSSLEDTNDASVRLRELERDVQASRSVYEAFLVRTREVSEQERLDTTNIRVMAPPEFPENRSFPPRNLFLLAGGGMLGGLLGIGFAFLGEWRDRRAPALPEPLAATASAAPAFDPYAPPGQQVASPARYAPAAAPAPYPAPARAMTPALVPVPLRAPLADTRTSSPGVLDQARHPHDPASAERERTMTATRVRSKQAFRL